MLRSRVATNRIRKLASCHVRGESSDMMCACSGALASCALVVCLPCAGRLRPRDFVEAVATCIPNLLEACEIVFVDRLCGALQWPDDYVVNAVLPQEHVRIGRARVDASDLRLALLILDPLRPQMPAVT